MEFLMQILIWPLVFGLGTITMFSGLRTFHSRFRNEYGMKTYKMMGVFNIIVDVFWSILVIGVGFRLSLWAVMAMLSGLT